MTDCPLKLTTGANLIVSIEVYLLPAAFISANTTGDDDRPRVMFGEGLETSEEKSLRERKSAILRLFDVIGLRSQSGTTVEGGISEQELQKEALQKPQASKKKHVEIVGDGEEIEVEDGEDLSKNDLDIIYKRYERSFLLFHPLMSVKVRNTMIKVWQKWSLQNLLR